MLLLIFLFVLFLVIRLFLWFFMIFFFFVCLVLFFGCWLIVFRVRRCFRRFFWRFGNLFCVLF